MRPDNPLSETQGQLNQLRAYVMRFVGVLILLFTLACAFALCRQADAGGRSKPKEPEENATTGKPEALQPIPETTPGVTFSPVPYYSTPAGRVKIKQAADVMSRVVASQCFADFLGARPMIQTQGKTPAQVVSHIRNLRGTVPVNMYYARFSSAVAYRQPPYLDIHFNRKFFGLNTPDCEWASTLAHEALGHALGDYTHDYKWNPQRDYSVPYSLNKAFQHCCHAIK